jgi:hypothetical protein
METRQTGWLIIIAMAAAMLLILGLSIRGTMAENGEIFLFLFAPVMIIPALLFYQLTVIVDYNEVKIRFGIGVIRKTWQLSKIESAAPVKNNILHGWGIHYATNATIYNVSGFKAVELRFRNSGRKVRIGTSEPEKLAEYINRMIEKGAKKVNSEQQF